MDPALRCEINKEDNMARTPTVTREHVPEDQRTTFDELVQQRGGVPTHGPGSIMFNAPEIAKRGLELARYLREETSLSPRIRELAMLTTARENDCQFIWNAHAPMGRAAGLRDEIIDNLRDKHELTGLSPDEAAVVNYGRELVRSRQVSQATFDAAHAQFGVQGVTELTNLIGCYTMLAFNLNAFGAELPPEITEKPLPV
jgi:4-carboxymuconolactone decarboxylase